MGRDLHSEIKPTPEMGDSHNDATAAVNSLRADADLATPRRIAKNDTSKVDVLSVLGPEKEYLAAAPGDARREQQLPPGATSEELFKKEARDSYDAYRHSTNHREKAEALKEMGLTDKTISPETIFQFRLENERKAQNAPANASFEELEQGRYKKLYKDVKDGTLPIDYN